MNLIKHVHLYFVTTIVYFVISTERGLFHCTIVFTCEAKLSYEFWTIKITLDNLLTNINLLLQQKENYINKNNQHYLQVLSVRSIRLYY